RVGSVTHGRRPQLGARPPAVAPRAAPAVPCVPRSPPRASPRTGSTEVESMAIELSTKARTSKRTKPPFRADQVGSLLRPQRLHDARTRRERGEITAEELRAIEDDAIRDAVTLQESLGFKGVSDGEFRRTFFHLDFLEQIGGVETEPSNVLGTFKRADGVDVHF